MKIAPGEGEKDENGKDKAAQSLGRRGGKARAVAIDPARRREIARQAAKARWQRILSTADRLNLMSAVEASGLQQRSRARRARR